MKKEYAYRDKSGCYVAFEYNGHVFVLTQKNKTAEGKDWAHPFFFCAITSTTGFAATFQTVEEVTTAVKKIGLKVIYTQEWEELENKNFNSFCVDMLQWEEWHEYQEVLRYKAPLAAIAVGNRVYKDTYSTALSDGSAWVFAAGEERLFGFPVQATHKIDQLLIAVSQYPDMKLFDTEEERTEWSLKYLEEYAAKPEPTPEPTEQPTNKKMPEWKKEIYKKMWFPDGLPAEETNGSIIDPFEAWSPDKQTYCCAVCNGEIYYPRYNHRAPITFNAKNGNAELRDKQGSRFAAGSFRELCRQIARENISDTHACYTQSREGYELFIKAHIPKDKQQEILEELPGVDMAEPLEPVVEVAPHTHAVTATAPPNSTIELPQVGLTNVPRNSCIVHAFESQGTPKLRPIEIAPEPEFARAAVIVGKNIFASRQVAAGDLVEWKFLDVATARPLRVHQGIEFAEDLGSDITATTLAGLIAAAEERGKELGYKVAKFTSEANCRRWINSNTNGAPLDWSAIDDHPAHRKVSSVPAEPYILKASPGSVGLTADSGIKTMKPGVTPQPSRNRIGKIAARPYEYVYDGPQQMGTTFVSRYRIDDEVWVRMADSIAKMKVVGIFVSSCKGKLSYLYDLDNGQIAVSDRLQDELYDTLFDLISAMTSISVEDLIAAAKEVV